MDFEERTIYGDFETWVLDNEIYNRVFCMNMRNNVDGETRLVYLAQIIPMPDNRILIGIQEVDDIGDNPKMFEYYYLDEMLLRIFEDDN